MFSLISLFSHLYFSRNNPAVAGAPPMQPAGPNAMGQPAGPNANMGQFSGAGVGPQDVQNAYAPGGDPNDYGVQNAKPPPDPMTLAIQLAGEIVFYLVIYFVWRANCMYRKRTVTQATREQFTGDLAPVGVFDCFGQGGMTIVEACCCDVCVAVENLEKGKSPSLRAPEISFVMVAVFQILSSVTCFLYPLYMIVSQRLELSKRPEGVTSDNNCCFECLKVCCCCPCSNMQVATFLEHYDQAFEKDERTPLEAPQPQAL
jgi:hypothetical protein